VDRGVYLLPDEVSYEDGTFIEPLACVLRGQRLARLQPGQTVLVLGSGISGLLHVQLARKLGAGRVFATDINEYRLKSAAKLGAEAVMHAKDDVSARLRQFNGNTLADLVIVCTGMTPAFTQALRCVDRGGTVLFFAPTNPGVDIPVPVTDLWRQEVTLMTSYGASPMDLNMALQLIRAGIVNVNQMITHRLGLAETGEGFGLVADAEESIKVIIEPWR
jgi:L-iditol 2-dehydrogenase